MSEAVYEELSRLAEIVLDSGRPVVIDASFRTASTREAARALATRRGIPFTMLECSAADELIRERLAARERSGAHVSDARGDLFDEFKMHYEPIDELPACEHHRLDTSRPYEDTRRLLETFFED
jgi:predicted kinase